MIKASSISIRMNVSFADRNGPMGEDPIPRRLFHHLLRLPRALRAFNTVHVAGSPQRATVPSHEDRPAEQAETLQGEQKIRMQET